MKKIFVPNRGCHDLSGAKEFGELVYMSEGPINRYAVSRIYREFIYHLCDSKPEDYILVTGLTVMVGIAMAILSRMHGRVNLLLYKVTRKPGNNDNGRYLERTIMVDELLKTKGEEK